MDREQNLLESVSGARTFAIVNIIFAVLMFGGIATINCFLFLSTYNSYPIFTDDYDRLALIMSWLVGVLEIISFGAFVYAVAVPLRKTAESVGSSPSAEFYLRLRAAHRSEIQEGYDRDKPVVVIMRSAVTAANWDLMSSNSVNEALSGYYTKPPVYSQPPIIYEQPPTYSQPPAYVQPPTYVPPQEAPTLPARPPESSAPQEEINTVASSRMRPSSSSSTSHSKNFNFKV